MADPLSLMASIAGVATAGVTISISLYEIANNVKRAPKEVAGIAKELSMISSILRNLKAVLKDTEDICKPRLIKDTKELLGRIRTVHKEIREITRDSGSSLYRMKLLFRGSRTKAIMAQIEGYKSTLNIILGTIQLATLQAQAKISKVSIDPEVTHLKRLLQTLLLTGHESMTDMSKQFDRFDMHLDDRHGYRIPRDRPRSPARRRSSIEAPRANVGVRFQFPPKTDLGPQNVHWGGIRDKRENDRASSTTRRPRPRTRTRVNSATGAKEQRRVHPSLGKFTSYYESEDEDDQKKKSASSGEEYIEYDEDDDNSDISSVLSEEERTRLDGTSKALILRPKSPPKNSEDITRKPDQPSNIPSRRPRVIAVNNNFRSPSPKKSINLPTERSEANGENYPALINGKEDKGYYVPPRSSMGPDWNKQAAKWDSPPDDTASWLYRLVFMDETPPGIVPKPLFKEELPAAVTRLLIQWTSADPVDADQSTNTDEGYQSQEGSEDPEWDKDVEKVIRNLKYDWDDTYEPFLDDDYPASFKPGQHYGNAPIPPFPDPTYVSPYPSNQPLHIDNMNEPKSSKDVDSMNMTVGQLRGIIDTLMNRIKSLEENCDIKDFKFDRMREETTLKLAEMKALHAIEMAKQASELKRAQELNEALEAKHIADTNVQIAHVEAQKAKEELADAQRAMEEREAAESCRMICIPKAHKHELSDSILEKTQFVISYTTPFANPIAIHGTLCWARPFLISASEMFHVLKLGGWQPLWMRGSKHGETWFLGAKPVLVNVLTKKYAIQAALPSDKSGSLHGEEITWAPGDNEYAAVGIGLVDREAIDMLDLPYIGQYGTQYRFDVSITSTDVENLIAASLLLRERRLRKACRAPRSGNSQDSISPRASPSTDAEGVKEMSKARPVHSEDEKYLRPRSSSHAESRNSQDEREVGSDGKKKHRKKRHT